MILAVTIWFASDLICLFQLFHSFSGYSNVPRAIPPGVMEVGKPPVEYQTPRGNVRDGFSLGKIGKMPCKRISRQLPHRFSVNAHLSLRGNDAHQSF